MTEAPVEIPEEKTHSIVELDSELWAHHIGEPVTYNGVEGKLIRYIPEGGSLFELTLTEVIACLEENRSKNSE
jgi:hypothetical protein